MTPRLTTNGALLQETGAMTYIAPPTPERSGESDHKTTEITEETKDERGSENNEELFKHLSYLSQLNNDVQKH